MRGNDLNGTSGTHPDLRHRTVPQGPRIRRLCLRCDRPFLGSRFVRLCPRCKQLGPGDLASERGDQGVVKRALDRLLGEKIGDDMGLRFRYHDRKTLLEAARRGDPEAAETLWLVYRCRVYGP